MVIQLLVNEKHKGIVYPKMSVQSLLCKTYIGLLYISNIHLK